MLDGIIINGIRHSEHAYTPSTVKILEGGVGFPHVTINVLAASNEPMASWFRFYVSEVDAGTLHKTVIDDFFETEIDMS